MTADRTLASHYAATRPVLGMMAVTGLLIVVLTGLNLFRIAAVGPNDDAYITYRVARNLATGHGPVFNPGERVLSISNPGYMLLLAASSVLGDDYVRLGLLLNGLALLAVGALLVDLSRQPILAVVPADGSFLSVTGPSWLAAIVSVALTLANWLLSESVGMETPLYIAALLAAFAAYRRALQDDDQASRWLLWTAAAATAAFVIRPDGLLVGLIIGLHWLVARRRIPWPALALGLLLALPWVLFAWAYYGSPIPNTLAAKVTQGLGDDSIRWAPGLLDATRQWARSHLAAALLASLGLVLALARRRLDRVPMLLWALAYAGAHALLDVRSYYWYYVPLIPVAALLAGDGAAWLLARAQARLAPGRGRAALVLAALVILAITLYPALQTAVRLVADPGPRPRELAFLQTAAVLAELCQQPDAEPVGMAEIGLLGYYSDCRVLDFSGLLQPELAHLQVPAADKMAWAIKSYVPPLVLLAGDTGYPRIVSGQEWFRQRYEVIDIRQSTGFLSIIHRRWPGPPSQRDPGTASWWNAARPGPMLSLESGQPFSTTLAFPPGIAPAVTLHAALPPESTLDVRADGEPVARLAGEPGGWLDYDLPAMAAASDTLSLSLIGHTGSEPAAVAWIESNAIPAVHYFAPVPDLDQRPRPRLELAPGQGASTTLAAPVHGPLDLVLNFRDRPGVALEVRAAGQLLDTVGGHDGWLTARLPLPPQAGPLVAVEIANCGTADAGLVYAALVAALAEPAPAAATLPISMEKRQNMP